jgi:alkanesulfonate monooxygenase SsuD/methylene tetrahydromethanopterin reductase-like flavin-dependent oxidoreductase (luciferase family)
MGSTNRQLTGEFGDGWIPLLIPNTGLAESIEAVETGAQRQSRSLEAIDIAPWVPCCISESDPAAARTSIRSVIAFHIGGMGEFYAETARAFGYGTETNAITEAWGRGGIDAARDAVTDDMVTNFGAAGTPSQAAESFDRFAASGADSPVAYIPQTASAELTRETVRHL